MNKTICCRDIELEIGNKTLIMGILNITPDSFSDGGKFFTFKDALAQVDRLVRDGADIIDIGAESTRPGHIEITAEEEWARMETILMEAVKSCPLPLSIDTQKAAVAEKALALGAHIINDIWGLQKDKAMAGVIAAHKAAVVLMHNRPNSVYQNLMEEIIDFLQRSIERALAAGIGENQIIIDPGIGFGKTTEQNLEVIRRLDELQSLGFPILLGVSRKSVIGKTLNLPVEDRLEPTIALGTLGIAAGVDILRVHDVRQSKNAALMADWIVRRKDGEKNEN